MMSLRRTKKTVPKPEISITPAPPSPLTEEEYGEEREKEGEIQKGFQLAFSTSAPTEVEGGDEESANDNEDTVLLESSDNYRR